jgi:hypothetical protein
MNKLKCDCGSGAVLAECDLRLVQGSDGRWMPLDLNIYDVHFVCQEGHPVEASDGTLDEVLNLVNNDPRHGGVAQNSTDEFLGELCRLALKFEGPLAEIRSRLESAA